jgi:succinate dehydrogenase flavin-adding protein (antitoxin of CptAB toxin-antitoxin module)
MVGILTLQSLQMETIEDYFEYILESKINGQHRQAKILFEDLEEGMKGQQAEFFRYVEDYFSNMDVEELKMYFSSKL